MHLSNKLLCQRTVNEHGSLIRTCGGPSLNTNHRQRTHDGRTRQHRAGLRWRLMWLVDNVERLHHIIVAHQQTLAKGLLFNECASTSHAALCTLTGPR